MLAAGEPWTEIPETCRRMPHYIFLNLEPHGFGGDENNRNDNDGHDDGNDNGYEDDDVDDDDNDDDVATIVLHICFFTLTIHNTRQAQLQYNYTHEDLCERHAQYADDDNARQSLCPSTTTL